MWPGIDKIAPADSIERLVWFASDEVAPPEPWVPTGDEQTAAWMAVYGEGAAARQQRADAARAHFGQGIWADGPEQPDPRISRV